MRKFAFLFVAALVICGTAQLSQAAVITFDSHPSDGGNPIFDSGYRFDFNASGWGVFGPTSGACCNLNYDGTPAMYADGSRDGRTPGQTSMQLVSGGTFSLSAFDAATYWTGSNGTLDVVGFLHGGGTVNASFGLSSLFASYLLPGTFTNLDSVVFEDSVAGGFLSAPGFGIDNINDAAGHGTVPEPATLSLLATGLAGLILSRRKKA